MYTRGNGLDVSTTCVIHLNVTWSSKSISTSACIRTDVETAIGRTNV